VRLDPAALGLRPGDQGAVTVRVDNVQGLYGAEVHLAFDPAMLEVVDADPAAAGLQVKPGDWLKDGFVAVNKADNAAGAVDFAVTLLNPAPAITGSGALFSVTLRAKANGNSALRVASALLASKEGTKISATLQDGAVAVSAAGQAPAGVPVAATAAAAPGGVPVGGAPTAAGSGAQPATGAPSASGGPSQTLLMALAAGGVLLFLAAIVLVVAVYKRRG
jgi:hypothetical protein